MSDASRHMQRSHSVRTRIEDRMGDASSDRWLISYSDFITLLFAFFVVMYASSSINTERYQVLSEALDVVFHAAPKALQPVQVGEPMLAASTAVVDAPDASAHANTDTGDTQIEPSVELLTERFAGFQDDNRLQIEANNDWIEVSIGGGLGFAAGSDALSPEGAAVVRSLGDYIRTLSLPVHVEGYTDNVPSRGPRHGSNWSLASARAATVAATLERGGIDRRRLSVVGYGDNHSIRSNATPAGRAANRRVVVVLARRQGLARDLNGQPGTSAFAHVRQDAPKTMDPRVQTQRTADGRLLFSN